MIFGRTDPETTDLQRLLGEWQAVELESQGQEQRPWKLTFLAADAGSRSREVVALTLMDVAQLLVAGG